MRNLWWLLAIGVAFAILMDGIFGPRSIVAPVIAAPAVAVPATSASAVRSDGAQADTSLRGRLPEVILFALAVVAEVASLWLFQIGWQFNLAWLLHVIAGTSFLSALWRPSGARTPSFLPGWTRIDTVALASVLLLALLARLWRVSTIPEGIWFDESDRGLQALKILATGQLPPFFEAAFQSRSASAR